MFFAAQGGYTDILTIMLGAGVHVDTASKVGGKDTEIVNSGFIDLRDFTTM